jgi:hypothetical protein
MSVEYIKNLFHKFIEEGKGENLKVHRNEVNCMNKGINGSQRAVRDKMHKKPITIFRIKDCKNCFNMPLRFTCLILLCLKGLPAVADVVSIVSLLTANKE